MIETVDDPARDSSSWSGRPHWLRSMARPFRRNPLLSAVIVITLACGAAGGLAAFDLAIDGWATMHPAISPLGIDLPPRLSPLVDAPPDPALPAAGSGIEKMGTAARDATTIGTIADIQRESIRGLLLLTAAGGGLLLLVTCLNLTLLLFSAGRARRGEIAMRRILGAGRRRITAQLFLEQVPLLLLATLLGSALLAVLREALLQSWPGSLTEWLSTPISAEVTALVLAAPLLTVALLGVLPLLLLREVGLGAEVAGGMRITANPHETLIRDRVTVLGIGLSITLMIAAGLLLKGFSSQLAASPYPFPTRDTLTFTVRPVSLPTAAEAGAERVRDTRAAVEALPGVTAVAIGSEGVWQGLGPTALAHSLTGVPGRPGITRPTRYASIASGSLSALGATFSSGRDFTEADRAGATAAVIVNRTFANRFFFGDPVGRTLQIGRADPGGSWFSVVGVIEDVRVPGIGNGAEPQPMLMLAARQAPSATFDLVARFVGDPDSARLRIERALRSAMPDAAITYTGTLDEKAAAFASPLRWFGLILALLAALTTMLSSFGLHSMIAFNVARRTRELGIRTAIGARGRDVIALVMRDSFRLLLRGCVLGLAGGVCAGRFLQFTFTGIEAIDPVIYALVLALTLMISLLASFFPARIAARTQPVSALAHD